MGGWVGGWVGRTCLSSVYRLSKTKSRPPMLWWVKTGTPPPPPPPPPSPWVGWALRWAMVAFKAPTQEEMVSSACPSSSLVLMNQLLFPVAIWKAVGWVGGWVGGWVEGGRECLWTLRVYLGRVGGWMDLSLSLCLPLSSFCIERRRTALDLELDDLTVRSQGHAVAFLEILLAGLVEQGGPLQEEEAGAVGDVGLLEQDAFHVGGCRRHGWNGACRGRRVGGWVGGAWVGRGLPYCAAALLLPACGGGCRGALGGRGGRGPVWVNVCVWGKWRREGMCPCSRCGDGGGGEREEERGEGGHWLGLGRQGTEREGEALCAYPSAGRRREGQGRHIPMVCQKPRGDRWECNEYG